MVSPTRRHLPSSPFAAPVTLPLTRYAVGDRVSHDRHGLGRVTLVDGEVAVHVDFGSGSHRLPATTTRMHKL